MPEVVTRSSAFGTAAGGAARPAARARRRAGSFARPVVARAAPADFARAAAGVAPAGFRRAALTPSP